jgi:hypothetical protein
MGTPFRNLIKSYLRECARSSRPGCYRNRKKINRSSKRINIVDITIDYILIMPYCDIVMRKETLETRILNRIERKRGDVFLRSDFRDLGGYDQVGRVLRDLVRKGTLLKVSHGLYTRAVKSPFSENPVPPKGLETLTEALRRVGVEVVQTRLEREYNAGLTTQVPTGRVVGVRRRVRRKIGYDDINLSFEKAGERPEVMS